MRNDTFAGYHPAVNFLYFAAVIGMTMFIMQPVLLIISLTGSCLYFLYLAGKRGMLRRVGYLLPLLLGMSLLNPLFNHEGITILWYLPNDNPVTLEAIVYGAAASAMMAAAVIWFNCCNAVFTSDKIIYLFGRIIPSLSLLISMTLRFVPRFKNYLMNVLQAQRALQPPKSTPDRLRQALSAFSSTVSWALEQSIITADSMKSRGYGLSGRTAFSIYRFEKRDARFLCLLAVLCAGTIIPAISGHTRWNYYPGLSGKLFGAVQLCAYICYLGACLLPLFIDLMEDRKWTFLRSAI